MFSYPTKMFYFNLMTAEVVQLMAKLKFFCIMAS